MKLNINNINIFLQPNFIFLLLNYQNILIDHSSIHTKNDSKKSNSKSHKINYSHRNLIENKFFNFFRTSKSNKKEEFLSLKKNELNLLEKQINNFDKILKELEIYDGKKKTHWIWYVFPNTREGRNEPTPKTNILINRQDNYIKYLYSNNLTLLKQWTEIFKQLKTMPEDDKGRVNYFYKEWNTFLNKIDINENEEIKNFKTTVLNKKNIFRYRE